MDAYKSGSYCQVLGTILLIEAAAVIFCLPVSLIYSEPVWPFVISAGICIITGGALWFLGRRPDQGQINNRETYLIVTSAWLVISIAGALPYLIGKTIPSFVDALFESASGLTTTGASILTDVEALPHSILFWRSMTHWIGGIGIIVLVILVLPSLKMTGYQLFSLESSLKEKIHPKAKGVVYRILYIYLGITALETIFLLLGGWTCSTASAILSAPLQPEVFLPVIPAWQSIHHIFSMLSQYSCCFPQ